MASTLRTSFQDQDHGNHQAEKLQRRQSKRQFFRNLLPKRESTINQLETVQDQDQSLGSNSEAAKLQRRQSKRVILRNLLLPKRNSIDTSSRRKSGQNLVSRTSSPSVHPLILDKPLPLPPPEESQEDEESAGTAARPVLTIERIMAPIDLADLRKLFSGAPQFFARSEGHYTGAPHPSVAFPWNDDINIRDLSDHIQIHDEAWSSVTAWPHIIRDRQWSADAEQEHHEKQKSQYTPLCRERPNMVSIHGIERGTMGFQAALEMGAADALQEPEYELPPDGPESLEALRTNFLNETGGIKAIKPPRLLELLNNVSAIYHGGDAAKHAREPVQMYTELFTQIMFPPKRVKNPDDPYSLIVQIEALAKLLATPDVWVDFGLVEWRIRLGQMLWDNSIFAEDEIVINGESAPHVGTRKYWLLLQILVSCELLLRLDTVTHNIVHGIGANPADISSFDKLATTPVRWSLLLARVWLENIQIEGNIVPPPVEKPAQVGWIASLTGGNSTTEPEVVEDSIYNVQWRPRHQNRQVKGLLHFARKLNWPNVDDLILQVAADGIPLSDSIQNTPAATPSSRVSKSYFPRPRPQLRRGLSRAQSRISALIRPSGWLSNSYLTGLILPGESLCHLLISTLLESDNKATSRLGDEANLYGGFVYSNKSFWSASCIVGRVLGAGKGSTQCMGWISSSVIPKGTGEGWVNIDVEYDPEIGSKDLQSRLWQKAEVERNGHIVAGVHSSSILPGDFILPLEKSTTQEKALSVKLEALDFFTVDSGPITPPEEEEEQPTPSDLSETPTLQTYTAMMRFSVNVDGEPMREINVDLRCDVYFVCAFPCIPSPHTGIIKTPTSPSFQSLSLNPSSEEDVLPGIINNTHQQESLFVLHSKFELEICRLPEPAPTLDTLSHCLMLDHDVVNGHPLYKGFTYTKLPLSHLLSTPHGQTFEEILSPPTTPTGSTQHTTNSPIPKVLVIDCTDDGSPNEHKQGHDGKRVFGSDMEMLARALCSERGWNALVSRRGRNCLACSVREAGALGWRVILRFA